jgi:hypothetical protein
MPPAPEQPEQLVAHEAPAVPPPPQYGPPAPGPNYAPPPLPQSGSPGTGYPPSYPPGAGYPPVDGNTSGFGEGYPIPPGVKGWTFAGFIPYGIFAFANSSGMWGAFGIVAHVLGLGLIYAIVLGLMGREIAWKARRFNSLVEFEETMAAWNKWGMIVLCAEAVLIGVIVTIYIVILASVLGLAMGGLN